jgi:hypothetical protein
MAMHIVRVLGFRLVIVAVVLVIMAAGWVVNNIRRSSARGDAQQTVSWFYDDARFTNFSQLISSSKDYLAKEERTSGANLEAAFGTLDRDDFANEFQSDGLLSPDELIFKVDQISAQDNDGTTAHMLVSGKIVPAEMKRGKTTYTFSDDTSEPFTHFVTLVKDGGSWYIAQIEPNN